MKLKQWNAYDLIGVALFVVSVTLLTNCSIRDGSQTSHISDSDVNEKSEINTTLGDTSEAFDCARDLKHLKRIAIQGDPIAQHQLSWFYYSGECVTVDHVKAYELMKKSAVQGFKCAQIVLGQFYSQGIGTARDPDHAVMWYSLAAKQGDAQAQMYLGEHYFFHQSDEPNDYEKAAKWFRLASNQGDSRSKYMLGYMYSEGQGVERNYQKAFRYYRDAAEQGNSDAQYSLALLYYNGENEVHQNYMEAFNWFVKAARNGSDDAREALIYFYGDGDAVSALFKIQGGYELFQYHLLEFGSAEHQYNEGLYLERGYRGTKNYTLAAEYYKRAAEKGLEVAQERLDAIRDKVQVDNYILK